MRRWWYGESVSCRDGTLERARRPIAVFRKSPRARAACLRAHARGCLPQLFYFRLGAARAGQLDAGGWRLGRAAVGLFARSANADAENRHASSPPLCRRLVGGGRMARRDDPRAREDG